MNLCHTIALFPNQIQEFTSDQKLPLGTEGRTRDGRRFRYASAGGTTLVQGNMLQGPAQIANHQNCAVQTAYALGDTSLSITLGATAATANQYAEGLAVVYDSTSKGYAFGIKSHLANAGSATLVLQLYSDDLPQVALSESPWRVKV